MSTSASDIDGVDQHVETSPNGRYIRYRHVLGKGAYKTVYKAFDTEEALEVAWNKLHVDRLSEHDLEKVSNEVSLLRQVAHKNIIHFYDTWRGVDGNGNQTINFITEQMMSGTLKEYLKRAKAIKLKVIRRWCRNILEAIAYLHSRSPPIMHRDLKCDNIFINGHVGEVKIGDLGLSGVKEREKADSVIGTPEFMAPELYEESYTEKVDIYAFGMCLLEMVSMEYPYSECNNMAQIFKKVFSGERPRAFEMLVDGDVKDVIAACLQREARRPSAVELLEHPLFKEWEKDVGTRSNLSLVKGTPESAAAIENVTPSSTGMPIGMQVIDWSDELGRSVLVRINQPDDGVPQEPGVQVVAKKENGGFFIWLEVPIRDAIKRVEFNFDPFQDSAERIAQEMAAEFQLGADQIAMIQEEIDRRVKIAKSQRAEASRNATPQPAHRQVDTNVESMTSSSQGGVAPPVSIPMPSQTAPTPMIQEPATEMQHTLAQPAHTPMADVSQVSMQATQPGVPQELQQIQVQQEVQQVQLQQSQVAVQEIPAVHPPHHPQQPVQSNPASLYSSPENESHLRTHSVHSSTDLHVSHGNGSREFNGINIRDGARSPMDVQDGTGTVPSNNNYVPSQAPASSAMDTSAVAMPIAASQEMQSTPAAIMQRTAPVPEPQIVSEDIHVPPPTLTSHPPPSASQEPSVTIGQELHVPPAVLAQQQVHSGVSESGINAAIQEARTGRVSELMQQRAPIDMHLREGRREGVITESLSQSSIHDAADSTPHRHPATEPSIPPQGEIPQPQPVAFSNSVSDPPPSSSRMDTQEPGNYHQFPHSVSDGQMPPPSPITVVDIPPRPTSTPVAMPSGVDLTVEHHVTSPSVAAVAYQGPEEEPRHIIQHTQQLPQVVPHAHNMEPRDIPVQNTRESNSNGHIQVRTQRPLQPSVPAIVVVGSTPKSVTADTSRRHLNDFPSQSLPSFSSTEVLTPEVSYVSSSTNGVQLNSQSAQAAGVSFSSPPQPEPGPSSNTASQRSPPGKAGAVRTNSWKSLQSDDSGNNLAPRVPLGKVIGEEHDQKYYTMCLTLMDHCAKGRVQDVVKKLEDGANPNFSDYDKRTPLHLAAAEGHARICSLLIENGAQVNQRDRWANTPLADASESGHIDVQNLLKAHGAVDERRACHDNINMELMRVAANGDLEAVRSKIVAGADVKYADYDQRTPLHLAATEGHPEIAELLLVNGASPNSRDRKGRTPVDDAVKNGHRNILRVLRQYGADIPRHLFEAQPELENQRGMDLIEHAARGRMEAVRKALDQGASPNFSDYDRRTALHLACVEGRLEVVRLLLESGASQNVVDRWGATPADEAKKGGFMNIVDELMLWDSKRKRVGTSVSFDHTALIVNGNNRSPPRRLDRESAHFDGLPHGIATSVSLGAMPQINLSADDFAAKYPSSSASSVSRADGSSVSLPLTPFDRSDEFGMNNIESEERLLRQAYDAERQRLEEKHRLAMEGLQRKKSGEPFKGLRVQRNVSAPRMSIDSPGATELMRTGEGIGELNHGRVQDVGGIMLHESLKSIPNGNEAGVQDSSRRIVGQGARTVGGSAVTSPVQVVRPTGYPRREAILGRDVLPMHVNPEIRSLVDNLIDLASAQR